MKKICGIISKEELKWLSKNVKRKPNYSKCTNCPFGILKMKKKISCVEFFEKAFGIKHNFNCYEINGIMYNFFNKFKQNKI